MGLDEFCGVAGVAAIPALMHIELVLIVKSDQSWTESAPTCSDSELHCRHNLPLHRSLQTTFPSGCFGSFRTHVQLRQKALDLWPSFYRCHYIEFIDHRLRIAFFLQR